MLRKRYSGFSAEPRMRPSVLTICCQLLERLGVDKRVNGSHHLFRKSGIEEEKINLQRAGTNAKPYQVKQFRAVILKAKLGFQP
jgi:hypothetical protein